MTKQTLVSWISITLAIGMLIFVLSRSELEIYWVAIKLLAVVVIILPAPTLAVVWFVRAIFGLYAGLVIGRIAMLLMALLPMWLVVECVRAMDVPPVIIDDAMHDNDGNIRFLFLMNLTVIPSAIISLIVVWLSNQSFLDRLKGVSSAPGGVQN